MKKQLSFSIALVMLCAALMTSAGAEVVYTPMNLVIPANGTLRIDLNHDGTDDFVLQSNVGLVWCQLGDGGYWKLTMQTLGYGRNGVVTQGVYAAALPFGALINSSQVFSEGAVLMAYLGFGQCGEEQLGSWRNQMNRYAGLEFQANAAGIMERHYGWIRISDVATIDENGDLHVATVVTGFAYETVPGQTIVAGQTF